MKKFYLFLLLFSSLGLLNVAKAQNISNEGSDFWLAFPTHDPNVGSNGVPNLATMNVFITSRSNSEVTITYGAGKPPVTLQIPANTVVPYEIPRVDSYIADVDGNKLLTGKSIHIKTTAGKPNVAVYAHVYAAARSAATVVLPTASMGSEYYSMNYTQDNGGRNFFVIIATEDNTLIEIVKKNIATSEFLNLSKAGDVYEYYPKDDVKGVDLTGYIIKSHLSNKCKTFAVFSGSTSNTIACTGSRDPLLQQLYPVNSWGKNYGVVPFFNRRYLLRVMAKDDNTTVQINGATVKVLAKAGDFYETPTPLTSAVMVKADKLVSVAQYSLTQGCSSITGTSLIGDPDMVILNPIEFSIKTTTLFSSNKSAIDFKYLNVLMKTDKTSTFRSNGAVPVETWIPVAFDPSYSYIQIAIPLTTDNLTLTASDGFNAIAYGFGSAESYAYTAGTNLATSQYLTAVNETTKAETSEVCIGQSYDFKVTVPYSLDKIVWRFEDGSPDYVDTKPVGTSQVVNGQTLYTYPIPIDKVFATVGVAKVHVTATLTTAQDACAIGDVPIDFEITVNPLPKADFTAPLTACAEEEISFADKSVSNITGKNVDTWIWDFGDGTPTSTLQNPKHSYIVGNKTYDVKLIASVNGGCISDVKTYQITVNPKAQASFTPSTTKVCLNTEVSFTDKSTVDAGKVSKWSWNFDDPTSGVLNTSQLQNPKHNFLAAGVHNVTLTIESDKGCTSKVFTVAITVNALPKSSFTLPEACLPNLLTDATFPNTSVDFDNTNTNLTYLWNFGDVNATPANNTSSVKDGKHLYSKSGTYTVTLTVTNPNGCIDISTQQYHIFPRASVAILASSKGCTNEFTAFKDNSTIETGGTISGWNWNFDDPNSTSNTSTLQNPTHKFDVPGRYNVTLSVVTTDGCKSNVATFPIDIYDIPKPDFDVPVLCLDKATATFTNKSTDFNNAVTGLTYAWDFGDPNATAANNKSSAINGVHTYTEARIYTVTLTVTNPNGCKEVVSKTFTVNSSNPIASFTPIKATICSNETFTLTNTSSVPGVGKITRLEWYFDGVLAAPADLNPAASPKDYVFTPEPFVGLKKEIIVTLKVYTGADNTSCSNISLPQTITINAIPVVKFDAVAPICMDEAPFQLEASETAGVPGTAVYMGKGVSASGFFDPALAGPGTWPITYTVTTASTCSAEITQNIVVNAVPKAYAGPDIYILKDGSKMLEATASGDRLRYKWSPLNGLSRDDILNPVVSPTEDTKYTLTVTSETGGCIAIDEVLVHVLPDVDAPNSFTPNGDGVNDVWNIKYIDTYPGSSVEIYNRNGQRVFFSRGYPIPFDGTYNNQSLPVGTYYYIINTNTGRKRITGNLTIIR